MSISVREIVATYLRDRGYDGLCEPGECGCEIEEMCLYGDHDCMSCKAAYKVPADADFKAEFGDECDWMFSTTKETQ